MLDIDRGSGNDRTKSKVSKIYRTTSRIWNHKGFTGDLKKSTLCRLEMRKKILRIDMAAVFASLSADPVFNPKYDDIVDIRSLKETEGVSERVMIYRRKSLAINALR